LLRNLGCCMVYLVCMKGSVIFGMEAVLK